MARKKSYWGIMKRIVAALSSIAKAKTLALKSKTNALKTRIVIFSLLNDKKLVMSSISHKFQDLLGHHHHLRDQESKSYGVDDVSTDLQSTKAFVIQSNDINDVVQQETLPDDHQKHIVDFWKQEYDGDGDGDKYPNLTHSMFEMEEEEDDEAATSSVSVSVIEMVKHSKEEKGEKFKLEDEIDHVADLFIKKFHRHILLQKQHSLKSYQDMLQRST